MDLELLRSYLCYFSIFIPVGHSTILIKTISIIFLLANTVYSFFFTISGFVIYYSLTSTTSFLVFWKKRFIRLFPSMLLASILTFVIFNFFDNTFILKDSHEIKNFLPSITFINPLTFNLLVHHLGFNINTSYLNGSYWSLWPEVQFYLFASIIYYTNKVHFIRNFSLISIALIIIHIFFKETDLELVNIYYIKKLLETLRVILFYHFNLAAYLSYFAIGTLLCQLYTDKNLAIKKTGSFSLYIIIPLILLQFYLANDLTIGLINFLIIIMFVLFIFQPKYLFFAQYPIVKNIGISSYFLYLIHEHIGVLIIHNWGGYLHPTFIAPLVVIICFIIMSILYYTKIEKNISARLTKLFINVNKKK